MKRLPLLAAAFCTLMSFASAEPLKVGDPAPAVTATTDAGTPIDLGAVYSKNPYTLVYFYPKADTPGCTSQGCSLRDAYTELSDRGVAVVGVSTDPVDAQKAFKEKHDLPFTLVADTDRKVMQAFGNGGTSHAQRQAYLVHEGRIVYADHQGSTTQQADDVLKFLDKQ